MSPGSRPPRDGRGRSQEHSSHPRRYRASGVEKASLFYPTARVSPRACARVAPTPPVAKPAMADVVDGQVARFSGTPPQNLQNIGEVPKAWGAGPMYVGTWGLLYAVESMTGAAVGHKPDAYPANDPRERRHGQGPSGVASAGSKADEWTVRLTLTDREDGSQPTTSLTSYRAFLALRPSRGLPREATGRSRAYWTRAAGDGTCR